MKKIIIATLALAIQGYSTMAQASWATASVRYGCDVHFQVAGTSVFLALGFTQAEGGGEIRCTDYQENQTVIIPIRAQLKGPGAGFGIQEFTLDGGISKALVESSPESLLGEYVNASVSGAVGVGAGLNSGGRLSLNKGAFVMNLSLSGQRGLGVNLSVYSITLSQSGPTKTENAPELQAETESKVEAADNISATTTKAITPPSLPENPTSSLELKPGQTLVILNDDGQVIKRFRVKKK